MRARAQAAFDGMGQPAYARAFDLRDARAGRAQSVHLPTAVEQLIRQREQRQHYSEDDNNDFEVFHSAMVCLDE